MTEDEAKEKWCPERSKIAIEYRNDPYSDLADCIASKCMMWRWEHDEDGQQCGWGYCGLAGR